MDFYLLLFSKIFYLTELTSTYLTELPNRIFHTNHYKLNFEILNLYSILFYKSFSNTSIPMLYKIPIEKKNSI